MKIFLNASAGRYLPTPGVYERSLTVNDLNVKILVSGIQQVEDNIDSAKEDFVWKLQSQHQSYELLEFCI